MKQLIFSVLVFGLLLSTSNIYSNDLLKAKKEFKKEIKKEFKISANGTVELVNKYGDIRIQESEGNNVVVEVEIIVKASSQSKADDIFEKININFSEGSNNVSAKTEIETNKSWWGWKSSGKQEYRINYHVQLPKTVKLNLTNKYGNIYGNDHENNVDVILKYGDINMGIVEGNINVDLGYGKANFVSLGDLTADIKYSSFKVNQLNQATFVSKYSKIFIDEGISLTSDSKYDDYNLGAIGHITNIGKYDDFNIESVGSLNIDSKYTNLSTAELLESAELKFKYGSIKVHHIMANFSKIEIESDYVAVKLGMDKDANFTFDIDTEYAPVNLPENYNFSSRNKYKNNFEGKGEAGKGSGGFLKVNLDYGSLKIYKYKSE